MWSRGRRSVAALFIVVAACTQSQPDQHATREAPGTPRSFAQRNGHDEAISDRRAGKHLTVYTHTSNGVVPGWQSPGLFNCDPFDNAPGTDVKTFRAIPELAFHEGEPPLTADRGQGQAAYRFARNYNATTYSIRRDELVRACPRVKLEPDSLPRRHDGALRRSPRD